MRSNEEIEEIERLTKRYIKKRKYVEEKNKKKRKKMLVNLVGFIIVAIQIAMNI